jgi:signal transduction histidine kinase
LARRAQSKCSLPEYDAEDVETEKRLMRLADFILANVEPILVEWESFARSIWPGPATDPLTLRDHAQDILRATARDMKCAQSSAEQSEKSKGEGDAGHNSDRVDVASDVHAIARVRSGFDLLSLVAEYRALRASVIQLWQAAATNPDDRDLSDLTRFNESIDQSLTGAVRTFTVRVDYARDMFLAILGHDLRNPLNSVILSAQALALTCKLDPESAQIASQISVSAAAMARMVNDLLDFTQDALNAGMPIAPAAMDLKTLGQEVLAEMRAANPTRKLSLEAHGDLTGQWDAARLRQVISNLVGNALQHGSQTTPVQLSISPEASAVCIEVRNQGPPIPPQALPTIFDPMVRIASAHEQKRLPGSIGLGLHIAREVVMAHGGAIKVKSSAEQGTVFTVQLPRQRASGRN